MAQPQNIQEDSVLKNNQPAPNEMYNYSYYLTMNIDNICRVCLEKGPKLMPIFDPVKPPHFSILIMACASVQVIEGDGLPPYICHKCISKLNIAFQFKTQCESSDAKLRQCIENLRQLPPAPDLSTVMDVRNGDEQSSEESQDQDSQKPEEQSTSGLQSDPVDIHQLEGLDNPDFVTINTLSESERQYSDLKPVEIESKQEQVQTGASKTNSKHKKPVHQCETCGKIFRTKPGLIHHIRIHTGERPYVCHLCDKRFINGGHLHTHMRTHTGEKNHICAACGKAFATAQQLTKHTIAIHTSERPYACTYCVKRFASSSNLNTHTRIHTGEKNYHCDKCIKAFSTKGQLYQHLLVHSGEKAFLCEFCNKRFSQKAHLIRHQKIHYNYNSQ